MTNTIAPGARSPAEETIYLAEQRRFRRLEVSLPVWLAEAQSLDGPQRVWSLGYTRDVSLGGAKVVVSKSEIFKWQQLRDSGLPCLVRFDNAGDELITGRVRHVAREEDGNIWLGVEYDEGASEHKARSLKLGLKTVHSRRRWQSALVLTLAIVGLSGMFIHQLRGDISKKNLALWKARQSITQTQRQLNLLSQPVLVGTRAEGINLSFQRKEVQSKLRELQRVSNPDNQSAVEAERDRLLASQGVSGGGGAANLNLGIAVPYGYAWPMMTNALEPLLGRRVPTVVIFRDWKAQFPLADCRLARVGAKTLQITWEPWQFETSSPAKLNDISAGKYDSYIDSWAQSAKSFGSEVWIRWGHEFNGNWYPWSITSNNKNAGTYIQAFRHIHDRFNRAGASNVRWIWCMNAENVPNVGWNDPLRAYPGDAYVDMISIDGYNFGTSLPHSKWLSFGEVFAIPYSRVIKKFPNKPLMIGEIGCATVGGDKVKWIRDMDKQLRGPFRKFEGLVWFEVQKEADWRMTSSAPVLNECRRVWNLPYYRRGEA